MRGSSNISLCRITRNKNCQLQKAVRQQLDRVQNPFGSYDTENSAGKALVCLLAERSHKYSMYCRNSTLSLLFLNIPLRLVCQVNYRCAVPRYRFKIKDMYAKFVTPFMNIPTFPDNNVSKRQFNAELLVTPIKTRLMQFAWLST